VVPLATLRSAFAITSQRLPRDRGHEPPAATGPGSEGEIAAVHGIERRGHERGGVARQPGDDLRDLGDIARVTERVGLFDGSNGLRGRTLLSGVAMKPGATAFTRMPPR
jgi:hypothetical protein